MNNILAVIDASSKDHFERLAVHRMPGALPFAGKYRLIDFTLSNIKNARITSVAIFPYGNYRSLQDHVGSGKRWDLDRRMDGLFILPPKNIALPTENMLTFQRMFEHLEFFKRSNQQYVLITPANILWNVDYNQFLEEHIHSRADITEVMHENKRTKTFFLSLQMLLKYVLEYDTIPYKTLNDLVERAPSLKVNTINHQGYTKLIHDVYTYYKANLDMLRFDIGREVFSSKAPIYSKEKPAPPARYFHTASVRNSMVASGSYIYGTLVNSVIGRDCIIKKDAVVENSIIMSNCVIEDDTHLNHVILDKGTVVKRGAILEGTPREPFSTQKNQIITEQSTLRILMSASEAYPYAKTGGLADVVGSLSRHLVKKGAQVSVVLPFYKSIKDSFEGTLEKVLSKVFDFGKETRKIRLYKLDNKGVSYYFVESFKYFEREHLYGYDDDCERFAFFNKAVCEIIEDIGPFDVVHLHDWHVSLIPRMLKEHYNVNQKTLLTIHNIDYQGECLMQNYMDATGNEDFNKTEPLNFLEEGIHHASKLSTVSPTYRDELRYEYYGKNLTPHLLKREQDFFGILNGLSSKENPSRDKLILSPYHVKDLFTKLENKLFLQKQMKLSMGVDRFIIGMVTRITEQKGFELIVHVLEDFLANHPKAQFVLLGTGDEGYIKALRKIEEQYPSRVKLNIGFDATVPNYIYAGADMFLMPSRVEPCGLGQMIAMRYGTLPLVRKTGGLADTVKNYDPITKKGYGFSFYNYDQESLKDTLNLAYTLYLKQPEQWKKMMRRAMKADFGLDKQAQRMIELYQLIIDN